MAVRYSRRRPVRPKQAPGESMPMKYTARRAAPLSHAAIAQLAVAQNNVWLRAQFPNIAIVSDAVHDISQEESHVVAVYLRDDKSDGIPTHLNVELPGGGMITIATEIIPGIGAQRVHINQSDKIETLGSTEFGSVCCLVASDDDATFTGIVTAGHVYANGASASANGVLAPAQQAPVLINGQNMGRWYLQTISNGVDFAVARVDNYVPDPAYISFAATGFYTISDADVKQTRITLQSNQSGIREGFILDYNLEFEVPYSNGPFLTGSIILAGSTADRSTSLTLSAGGDSGGCVYNSATRQLVGMILGGDQKFTYILPLKDTFDNWDLKPR